MDIYKALEKFLNGMLREGCSPLTIKAYRKVIEDFINHCEIKKVEDIDKDILRKYHTWISEMDRPVKTKNLKIIPMRTFIRILNKYDLLDLSEEPLSTFRVKNDHKPFDLISREELTTFLEYKESPRNDLFVNMLYSTGLRVAEICNLNIEDVKSEFSILGKGKRQRTVFITPKVMKMFNEYKKNRPETGPLFTGWGDSRMAIRTAQRIVNERADYLGMSKKLSPHSLRHLYATHLYENGADLNVLKELLGHASLNTTQIYTHVSTERMRESYKKFKDL